MSNYASNLKTWGSTGSEFPDGYSYLEGDQPVDAWDNYLTYNTIEDIQHLISLTNDRLESDRTTSHPTSPEVGHLSYRTDTTNLVQGKETLYHYDSANSSWRRLMKADGDKMTGNLDTGGYSIKDSSGTLTLDSATEVTGSASFVGSATFSSGLDVASGTLSTSSFQLEGTDIEYDYFQSSENGEATTGDLSIIGVLGLKDGQTITIKQAAMIKQNISAVSSGIDLVLSSGSAKKATILTGDGATLYGDEQPGTTYTNTTGAEETLVVAIDNGHHNTGSGSNEKVHGSFIGMVS